jgi:Carboxypeptidase regulatory-like domain
MKSTFPSLRWTFAGAVALAFAATTTMFAQGVTTSGISGFVTNKAGQAISGATVTAVVDATGARYTATTRSTGQYSLSGLSSGGPYTVTATATGLPPAEKKDVYLNLGQTTAVDLEISTEIVRLEAVNVSESAANTTFDMSAMGTGSSFNTKQILQISSIRRDLQDFESLDPRAVTQQVSPSDPAYTFSVAGQNPRENAILVDGVSAADNFGLNSNGYAGLRNPVPLEWIASATLAINPFDVVYSGFLGAVTDVSLRSGTNDFHGTAYEIYTGTRMRGPDPVVGVLGAHESTQQHTTGATLGGPLWKDKLFFFVGYDAFRQIAAAPAQIFNPLASPQGQTDVTEVVNALKAGYTIGGKTYTYDPGSLNAISHTWEQNFVGKIDWNISDYQKFTFTFRHTIGDAPVFYNYTANTETSFDTSWYNSNRSDQSYTAQLNSDWSKILPNFHTEIEGTYKRYNGTATLNGPKLPALTIQNFPGYQQNINSLVTNGVLFTGTYWAYQDNNIYTWEQEEHAYGDYSYGNHTFKFGAQFDRTGYTDTFIPNAIGSYTFSDVTNFLAGKAYQSTVEIPATGFTLASDVSHYYLLDIVPLIQDTWKPNSKLTVIGGLRMDYPYEPQDPVFSPVFFKAYGFSNSTTMSGNYTISPRIGFNYSFDTKLPTQVRGGAGLFLGQNPVVWVENSFNNAGQLNSVTNGVASTAAPSMDYTDPNFHWPSTWKENIAIDKTLPWFGLIATAEVDVTQVNKDVFYQETNPYVVPTSGPLTMPDGRLRLGGNITPSGIGSAYYLPGYTTTNFYTSVTSAATTLYQNHGTAGVYELTNTSRGGSQEYTVELTRPLLDNWSASIAYTYTHATQVDPFTSSVAASGFAGQPIINPNDNIAYKSNYSVPNKFVATFTRQFNFFKQKNSMTSFSAQFLTETGQAYSFVFKGDADGSGLTGESLFYVPTGPNDPKVEWLSSTEEANFFSYMASNPQLSKWAGKIAPRNSATAGEQATLNLHLEQQVPLYYRNTRVVLYADCFNFANLLSKKWGVVDNFNNSFVTQTIAGTGYDKVTNKYIYVFNNGTLGTPTIYSDESRWQLQVGARLEF